MQALFLFFRHPFIRMTLHLLLLMYYYYCLLIVIYYCQDYTHCSVQNIQEQMKMTMNRQWRCSSVAQSFQSECFCSWKWPDARQLTVSCDSNLLSISHLLLRRTLTCLKCPSTGLPDTEHCFDFIGARICLLELESHILQHYLRMQLCHCQCIAGRCSVECEVVWMKAFLESCKQQHCEPSSWSALKLHTSLLLLKYCCIWVLCCPFGSLQWFSFCICGTLFYQVDSVAYT